MDPLALYRLLRRRWLILVVCVAVGAGLGYASTLFDSEEGPVVNYWTAGQVLIADTGADAQINLLRIGPQAVLGALPAQVAEEFGVEPAELGLRSVADTATGTLTISAISVEDPAVSRAIAAAASDAFIESIVADDLADYERQIQLLQTETRNEQQLINEVQEEIDGLNATIADLDAGESLTPAQQDRLSRAAGTRNNAEAAYAAAADALEALIVQGPPTSPVTFLQEVTPTRISGAAYQQRIAEAGQAANTFISGAASNAGVSSSASSSRLESPITRAVLGAIAGLLLGIMLVVVQARLDTRLRDRAGFEAAFGLPVIAEVPTMKRSDRKANILHAIDQPYSQITEAHRYIRSVLLFARANQAVVAPSATEAPGSEAPTGTDAREVRVIMVTSAGAGEGKTTTAANLAVMMAEAGYETLLVNCDHRRPHVHDLFDVPYAPGTVTETKLSSLQLITDVPRSEDESPARIAEHQRTVIRNARSQVDVVILDTAPILATNDALDLVAETDLVLLVARAARTTSAAAHEARELLIDRMGMPVTGVVVTGASGGSGDRYYDRSGYGGYYGPITVGAPAAEAGPAAEAAVVGGSDAPLHGPEVPAAEDAGRANGHEEQLPFGSDDDDEAGPASVEHWLDRLTNNRASSTPGSEPKPESESEKQDRVVNLRPGSRADDQPDVRRGLRG